MLPEILYYTLEEVNLNAGKLYCTKKGSKLRLLCNPQLVNKLIRVFCNIAPPPNTAQFKRDTFYEYSWTICNQLSNDHFDKYIEIDCSTAGSFQFYFTVNRREEAFNSIEYAKGGADIIVSPEFKLSNGEVVPLDSLQIQTVLTKLLGPVNEWEPRLYVSKQSGYNMIHFTPIEELSGESNSSYSLRNHLKLNSNASQGDKFNFEHVDTLIKKLYEEWNMFSVCDLVYNHMANDAPFLQECPEAAYNLKNSPFLKPAFILDRILYHLTLDISSGKYESRGLTQDHTEPHQLNIIKTLLNTELIPSARIEEFYQLDIEKTLSPIRALATKIFNTTEKLCRNGKSITDYWSKIHINQDSNYERLGCKIDFEAAKEIINAEFTLNRHDYDGLSETDALNKLEIKFRSLLTALNAHRKREITSWLQYAVDNVIASATYHFFADDGPKYQRINAQTPIVEKYFRYTFGGDSTEIDEKTITENNYEKGRFVMAHNGWVMNHNPLTNFCSPNSNVYIKRELIPWGDSVKLRYGTSPEDCPKLWEYMREYTRRIATTFHGVRLDNCHNTPLHVAQYFIDDARTIRPDLFVMAELFTNDAATDNLFVAKLGITALIRESMNAWDPHELGRLLHRFGGDPVGSFFTSHHKPMKESVANALFFDVTHDNKSVIKRHSVYDTLARSALVLMCNCAYGSTRGFDELVPDEIHVVAETRLYTKWKNGDGSVDFDTGIIKAKALLNNLHYRLAKEGFSEIFVDQRSADVIAITRRNPKSNQSVVLVARTAFSHPSDVYDQSCKSICIPLKLNEVLFEAKLVESIKNHTHSNNGSYINGLHNYRLCLQEHLTVDAVEEKSFFVSRIEAKEDCTTVFFKDLPPGAVIAFSLSLDLGSIKAADEIEKKVLEISLVKDSAIDGVINKMSFDELNLALFRCGDEEADEQIFSNVYVIPNYGPLVFCGLQGFVNVLQKTRLYNDLGHPIFENLRQGNWIMEYILRRLYAYSAKNSKRKALNELARWLECVFGLVGKLPRPIIPCFFDIVVMTLYTRLLERCFIAMSCDSALVPSAKFILNGSSFIHFLGLASLQFVGLSRGAKLPNTLVNDGLSNEGLLSIAAGLPHFSHGIMRNWGRDTFIALRGTLLLTNRFDDAKYLILTYGSCLRHGLIPNLLGEGICARYNARDAVWFWLKAIKDYTELVPNGYEILSEMVYRLYPRDDSPYPADIKQCPKQRLMDIVQEALSVHVNGLEFIERNAGPSIDEQMSEKGFHNSIGVNFETGFVYGGNQFNCGTWMDKMGSSEAAGIKGVPASPRDGSAVELVGLSRCVLRWLVVMNKKGVYEYDGVKFSEENRQKYGQERFSWVEWARKIDENFEKFFWVDESSKDALVHKRNIYKDCHQASIPWTDYQLRPNFLIALCLAPEMVKKEHARKALEVVKLKLFNECSIGIKTLDPDDMNYRGYYDNSNNSNDPKIAHGFNYHQGPEWLWPLGYYFRSLMIYANEDEKEDVVKYIQSFLAKHYDYIKGSDWKSLPELTNENGAECIFSCPSQAWTIACLLEACYDMATF